VIRQKLTRKWGHTIAHPIGGVGMTLDLEERNLVQDEGLKKTPNSDTCESGPEHNRTFVRPR